MNKAFFTAQMARKKLTLRGLAAQMGMLHSQVNSTLEGRRRMQIHEAIQLAQIFGVPLSQIIENIGFDVRGTGAKTRISAVLNGDGSVSEYENNELWVPRPLEVSTDALAIQCRTAGSPLDWMDGWVMFADASDQSTNIDTAKLSFCKAKDGSLYLGALRRGYVSNTHTITNISEAQDIELEWSMPILLTRN